MGIEINTARLLLRARREGASFQQTLMIGRQRLMLPAYRLMLAFRQEGVAPAEVPDPPEGFGSTWAEPFFRMLGADFAESIDASDFEGASIVHDMNLPVPASLEGRFDAVLDGGSLEHVFHFPEALHSCMRMVREGGRFFIHAPAVNHCGHGFYQFSPELFYRVLSPANGYGIERMFFCPPFCDGPWVDARDPAAARQRLDVISPFPWVLLVQARREAVLPMFREFPQQSDYSHLWTIDDPARKTAVTPRVSPAKRWLARHAPAVMAWIEDARARIRTIVRWRGKMG